MTCVIHAGARTITWTWDDRAKQLTYAVAGSYKGSYTSVAGELFETGAKARVHSRECLLSVRQCHAGVVNHAVVLRRVCCARRHNLFLTVAPSSSPRTRESDSYTSAAQKEYNTITVKNVAIGMFYIFHYMIHLVKRTASRRPLPPLP